MDDANIRATRADLSFVSVVGGEEVGDPVFTIKEDARAQLNKIKQIILMKPVLLNATLPQCYYNVVSIGDMSIDDIYLEVAKPKDSSWYGVRHGTGWTGHKSHFDLRLSEYATEPSEYVAVAIHIQDDLNQDGGVSDISFLFTPEERDTPSAPHHAINLGSAVGQEYLRWLENDNFTNGVPGSRKTVVFACKALPKTAPATYFPYNIGIVATRNATSWREKLIIDPQVKNDGFD